MRHWLAALMAAIVTVSFVVPLFAHHSIASEYDPTKATTIAGVMSKVEWINPHAWIYMNVKDANGAVAIWRIETASVGALTKAGLDKSMIDLTKTYSMEIWPAQDGSRHASGRTLTFDDGRTFDVSDKFPQSPVTK
jgi:hypothetical protein